MTPENAATFDRFLSHEKRWHDINEALAPYNYSVTWMNVSGVEGYRYMLHRLKQPYEKLGYWDDEEIAINMARMVLTQASIES